jgi:mRNA-degrading endonuclease RelE of RelBE toxin-antitoxin system
MLWRATHVQQTRSLKNSAERGKSGGFRVIYYVQLADKVVLLLVYVKTRQADISPADIRQVLQEIPPPDTE